MISCCTATASTPGSFTWRRRECAFGFGDDALLGPSFCHDAKPFRLPIRFPLDRPTQIVSTSDLVIATQSGLASHFTCAFLRLVSAIYGLLFGFDHWLSSQNFHSLSVSERRGQAAR